mmetsp:Transcript_34638/g.32996  ORF Transcript_34638/g.32996 Transcript_34638/m.32996 type:complete len:140 (-) Transcript_34638:241-660(-)
MNVLADAAAGSIACENKSSRSDVQSVSCEEEVSAASWSNQLTKEERHFITEKIRTAYQRKTPSYDELLDICCAIEEEHVFSVAPSKLDYFKSGVQYEKRIVEKIQSRRRCQSSKSEVEVSQHPQADDSVKNVKRAKTLH